ncbi:hypothetical protein PsYK624_031030 [Phanerochaete sordida]|uniref:Uncharacterized protein n=1 Tax=Phanerochaete sordida TaxID=48140 RepID=A0A9P3G357_9APHY|nr:hypothetical protein PsYK624_031030 [Phanerochaete sordida]
MHTPPPALLFLALAAATRAMPTRRQLADDPSSAPPAVDPAPEADGHLDSQWIIVIAVIIAVVVLGVVATMVWVRLRRKRRSRAATGVRAGSPYGVRQAHPEPVSRKGSADPIATPLPALTYQRLRDSSTSTLGAPKR